MKRLDPDARRGACQWGVWTTASDATDTPLPSERVAGFTPQTRPDTGR